jgi:hypothetical protein
MAAIDNTLQSNYLTEPVVRRRNSVTLTTVSASKAVATIPTIPDDAWIRARVLAEAVPLALDSYTIQTLPYFLQDPSTQTNVRQLLNAWNDDATEVSLSASNETIATAFWQRWADTTVNAQQVADWKARNGF